jgi:hypothetical protein
MKRKTIETNKAYKKLIIKHFNGINRTCSYNNKILLLKSFHIYFIGRIKIGADR